MFVSPIFYPGQQVICTNADFSTLLSINPYISVPEQDKVYTIRKNYQFVHDVGVTLMEIINVPVEGSKLEVNFRQERFVAYEASWNTQVIEEELYQAA